MSRSNSWAFAFAAKRTGDTTAPPDRVRVEELGWKDADRSPSPLALPFPHETPQAAPTGWSWPAPGSRNWTSSANRSDSAGPTGPTTRMSPCRTIERLIILGPAGWTSDAPGKLLRAGVSVQFVSEGGWPLGELLGETTDDPEALIAQCRAATDPETALSLARPLVHAKLRNFATLVEALAPSPDPTASRLRELAEQSRTAGTLDALRGVEGSGAAALVSPLAFIPGQGLLVPQPGRARCRRSGEHHAQHRTYDAA